MEPSRRLVLGRILPMAWQRMMRWRRQQWGSRKGGRISSVGFLTASSTVYLPTCTFWFSKKKLNWHLKHKRVVEELDWIWLLIDTWASLLYLRLEIAQDSHPDSPHPPIPLHIVSDNTTQVMQIGKSWVFYNHSINWLCNIPWITLVYVVKMLKMCCRRSVVVVTYSMAIITTINSKAIRVLPNTKPMCCVWYAISVFFFSVSIQLL